MHPAWMQNVDPPPRKSSRPVAAASPAPPRESLFRSLFGMSTPNEVTRMHHSDSFGDMSFIGGEEEAHDAWHDKWEAHRRISFEQQAQERAAVAVIADMHAGSASAKSSSLATNASFAAGGGGLSGKKISAPGLAAPGEVYKRAASLDNSSSAAAFGVDAPTMKLDAAKKWQSAAAKATAEKEKKTKTKYSYSDSRADDPWRSVFHPGRNYNMKGKNNLDDKGNGKSVMDHHIAAEASGKNVKYHDAMKSALYEGRVD